MKNSYRLYVCLLLLSATRHTSTMSDQDFNSKLNILQQSITVLVTQSDIDPETAQDILDKTNILNQYVQNNIQQDITEIRVAAGISSILETADKMLQNMKMSDTHNMMSDVKYSARANTIHKLLIGVYPGKFKDQAHYTDPYTESVGFIMNNWLFVALFQAMMKTITPTPLGVALSLDAPSPINNWLPQVAGGVAAHCAWSLQKKLFFQQIQMSEQQATSPN